MSPRELTKPYEPNPLLRALYRRFFDQIQVDEAWVRDIRRLSEVGTVVYVLGTLNLVDFLALDHLAKRFDLPKIHFVNDMGLWVLNPSMGRGWWDLVFPRSPATQLRSTIEHNDSSVLFLRRPWGVVDLATGATSRRGFAEGDELVRTLFDLQRKQDRPILLVPQVFVWTKRPEPRTPHPLDILLEPTEWPNMLMTVVQFLLNYRHVALKVGEPLNLKEYLASDPTTPDPELRRRASYVLLRRLDRERRSVTGPAEKAPDRVRMEILRSPKLRASIEDLAGERSEDRAVLTGQALAMLRELQARPDTTTRKGLEMVLNRVFNRIYAGIEYDQADIERLRQFSRKGTLVLLPSHKSHFDYFFLSYVFNDENLPMPIITSGDNLNFFPLGPLLRRGGAFFVRRSFKGDRLYAAVVDAYVRRLIREGHSIELFLEGTRSRTGKLLTPKFGLLNMIVDAALAASESDVFFVPVSIGYERVAELGAYERELRGFEKKKETTADLLKAPEVLRHRYGRINLQVGTIVGLEEVRADLGLTASRQLTPAKRRSIVTRIGNRVMDELNRVTAVTPGALTAMALLNGPPTQGVPHEELYQRAERLLEVLRAMGARVTPATAVGSGRLRREALRESLHMFMDGEMVVSSTNRPRTFKWFGKHPDRVSEQAIYSVPEHKRLALDLSKNTIIHFFVDRALISTAVKMSAERPVPLSTVRDRVRRLSNLFKYEFRFRADTEFDRVFDESLNTMIQAGELCVTEGTLVGPGAGALGWSGLEWITVYANMIRNFLEGYRVAARSLSTLLKGPLPEKELVKRALNVGTRMISLGEVERRESVCKPIAENALSALSDEECLRHSADRYELPESFRNAKAVTAIESRIAVFLEES